MTKTIIEDINKRIDEANTKLEEINKDIDYSMYDDYIDINLYEIKLEILNYIKDLENKKEFWTNVGIEDS